ncbi:unnamed protein product [Linum trigynum]|uniref:Uncharacterized protein n=1 Tax=Linum trigynum TaxID=586398 RepID=A0AAV2F901_9ROSI
MIEKVAASKDTDHPITEDEAFHEVLGDDPGYFKRLGYVPPRPSTKGKEAVEVEVMELREKFDQNQAVTAQMMEENRQLKDQLEKNQTVTTQLLEENKELKDQLEENRVVTNQLIEENELKSQLQENREATAKT